MGVGTLDNRLTPRPTTSSIEENAPAADAPATVADVAPAISGPATVDEFVPAGSPIMKPISPEEASPANEIVLMGLNTENLFNPSDAPDKDDVEFSPERGYTEEVRDKHIASLAKLVGAVNGGRGPDVLGLMEVEDLDTVQRLAAVGGYPNVVHFETPDARGIDQALVTRLPVKGAAYHPMASEAGKPLRGIVQADLDVSGKTLTVLVNHWPSKRKGEEAARSRMKIGAEAKQIIAKLIAQDPTRNVVMLGDLNEEFNEASRGPQGLDAQLTANRDPAALFDTFASLQEMKKSNPELQTGTYYFRNKWDSIDAAIVSGNLTDLLDATNPQQEGLAWVPNSTSVFAPDWGRNASGAPKRFFDVRGRPYRSPGFSDHFPVVFRIRDLDPSAQ
ncbi:MAG: endonuclease/exonuclease/phosphatase family protein [Myxococcaceae bacterium]